MSPATDRKITKAAKDFESILIGNWLQHAEDTFARAPGAGEGDDDDGTASMQQGLAIQPLAEALTNSGGIGIATMIATQLRRNGKTMPANAQQQVDTAKEELRPGLNIP
ncbi:rod-binding protein [Granulicella sp. 5B5]|uniref:rod-binding protein n=1 Tax=Granulicella sp. 5B5 TaxID=1617967 RepID=UPI0015F71E87|nr:rod-binding protein [Granulicella sp. 5B5]